MDRALHIEGQRFQYIARISHGKDSLKMLDVIVSRGLPLDRVTTTDIWATDTIRGEHPKMVAFKEQADEFIWRKYHIEVEHLCAMRNGEKMTYEKLFYHVPKRKNAGGGDWKQGKILGFPTLWGPWCQSDLKRSARNRAVESSYTSPGSGWIASGDSRSALQIRGRGASISRQGFWKAPPRGAVKISWNTWELQQTSRSGSGS